MSQKNEQPKQESVQPVLGGLIFLAIASIFYREFEVSFIKISDFLIVIVAVTIIAWMLYSRQYLFFRKSVLLSLVFLSTTLLISAVINMVLLSSRTVLEISRYIIGIIMMLATVFSVSSGIVSKKSLLGAVTLAAVPSAVMATLAGVMLILSPGVELPEFVVFGDGRVSVFIRDPNYYANALLLPLSASIYWTVNRRHRRYVDIGLTGLFSIALLFTKSRSGTIGLVVVFLLYGFVVWKHSNMRLLSWRLIFTVIIGVINIIMYLLSNRGNVLYALMNRVELWRQGLLVWSNSPVLGVGPGNYIWYLSNSARINFPINAVHNTFISVLTTLGALGGISFFLLLLLAVQQCLQYDYQGYGQVILFALIGVLLQGMFIEVAVTRWLWFLLGLAFSPVVGVSREFPDIRFSSEDSNSSILDLHKYS